MTSEQGAEWVVLCWVARSACCKGLAIWPLAGVPAGCWLRRQLAGLSVQGSCAAGQGDAAVKSTAALEARSRPAPTLIGTQPPACTAHGSAPLPASRRGVTSRLDFSLPSGDKMGAAMMHRAFKRSEGVQVPAAGDGAPRAAGEGTSAEVACPPNTCYQCRSRAGGMGQASTGTPAATAGPTPKPLNSALPTRAGGQLHCPWAARRRRAVRGGAAPVPRRAVLGRGGHAGRRARRCGYAHPTLPACVIAAALLRCGAAVRRASPVGQQAAPGRALPGVRRRVLVGSLPPRRLLALFQAGRCSWRRAGGMRRRFPHVGPTWRVRWQLPPARPARARPAAPVGCNGACQRAPSSSGCPGGWVA